MPLDMAARMLVIGNWKMNPRTIAEAKELLKDVTRSARQGSFMVAPPTPFIAPLALLRSGTKRVGFAAQDVSRETKGAHTGEVGAAMLASVGVTAVILGHSERRAAGESSEEVRQKVGEVLKAGLKAVVCVGERERSGEGHHFSVVEEQVRTSLKGVPSAKLADIAIAYEPVWAISTATPNARAATPEDAHEMVIFIRKVLSDLYSRKGAAKVKILYGGSVDAKNIEGLVAHSGAEGFLVGGASLRPRDFAAIVTAAHGG